MQLPEEYRGLEIKRETARRWYFLCPFHDDHRPSMTVERAGRYAGNFKCWACGEGGSPWRFKKLVGQKR